MPPSACAKIPFRAVTAPVKAPLTWPNSSLSKSVGVKAAQFTGMKGPRRRRPSRWIARATSSFPVPLSPRTSTVASVSATFRVPDHLDDLEEPRVARHEPVELGQAGRGQHGRREGVPGGVQHEQVDRAGRPLGIGEEPRVVPDVDDAPVRPRHADRGPERPGRAIVADHPVGTGASLDGRRRMTEEPLGLPRPEQHPPTRVGHHHRCAGQQLREGTEGRRHPVPPQPALDVGFMFHY